LGFWKLPQGFLGNINRCFKPTLKRGGVLPLRDFCPDVSPLWWGVPIIKQGGAGKGQGGVIEFPSYRPGAFIGGGSN